MEFPLPETLVKTLVQNLVKNLVKKSYQKSGLRFVLFGEVNCERIHRSKSQKVNVFFIFSLDPPDSLDAFFPFKGF